MTKVYNYNAFAVAITGTKYEHIKYIERCVDGNAYDSFMEIDGSKGAYVLLKIYLEGFLQSFGLNVIPLPNIFRECPMLTHAVYNGITQLKISKTFPKKSLKNLQKDFNFIVDDNNNFIVILKRDAGKIKSKIF